MKSTQPTLLKHTLAVSLLAVLTACGNNPSTNSGDSATSSNTKTAAPAGKNDVVIGNGAEPESLDPQKMSDMSSINIARQQFLGLVDINDQGETIPSVASEWSNVDNKVWTFKLRNDIKWSNGDPVTAHDFVYSLRRLTDPATASPYGSYLVDAKVVNADAITNGKSALDSLGVKALDDYTLEISLTDPVPYFADLLALPVVFAVHQKTVETHGDKWTDPANIVVNGAYKLTDWGVNSHIVLERNTSFYDNATTSIDKVTFLPLDGSAELNRYQAGEVDLTAGVEPSQYHALKKALGDEVQTAPTLCTTYMEFNTVKAPFDNPNVRRAFSLSFDRLLFTDKIMGTGQKSAYQFTPNFTKGMGEVKPDWADQDMATRNAQAVELLTQAGYSKDKPLDVELLYTTSDFAKKLVVAADAMWKENLQGLVRINPVNYEWKMVLENRRQGKYDLGFAGWCADYNEPSTFLNVLRSNNSNNSGKYSNPKYDQTLDATLQTTTAEERTKLYQEAERILQEDTPIITIYTPSGNYLVKPYLQGVSKDDPTHSYSVRRWKISQ